MKLTEYIFEKRPCMYFDETSMNHYQCQKKAWYQRNEQFTVPIATGQGTSFTIYGTVGDCLQGNSYFEIHDSTNKEDFKHYMRNLATKIIPSNGPLPILVLDNHKAHHGADRREIIEQFAQLEYIPAYSCELNAPIEAAWSTVKRRCLPKFTQLSLQKQSTRSKCIDVVKTELQSIDSELFRNLLRTHYPFLGELIQRINQSYILPMPVSK